MRLFPGGKSVLTVSPFRNQELTADALPLLVPNMRQSQDHILTPSLLLPFIPLEKVCGEKKVFSDKTQTLLMA